MSSLKALTLRSIGTHEQYQMMLFSEILSEEVVNRPALIHQDLKANLSSKPMSVLESSRHLLY